MLTTDQLNEIKNKTKQNKTKQNKTRGIGGLGKPQNTENRAIAV